MLASGSQRATSSLLLAYMNFWVNCNNNNDKCESVVAFLDEPSKASGFYTNLSGVGKLLKNLVPVMSRRVDVDSNYCEALYPIFTPEQEAWLNERVQKQEFHSVVEGARQLISERIAERAAGHRRN